MPRPTGFAQPVKLAGQVRQIRDVQDGSRYATDRYRNGEPLRRGEGQFGNAANCRDGWCAIQARRPYELLTQLSNFPYNSKAR